MEPDFLEDIKTIGRIAAAPAILEVICKTAGMGFAAITRVTEGRWIACLVRDNINLQIKSGAELRACGAICHEARDGREPVAINHAAENEMSSGHPAAKIYEFQSFVSVPVILADGEFFGTLCAIDTRPARLDASELIAMFKLFAELIAVHIDALKKTAMSGETHLDNGEIIELREQFIAVLGHDLRNPLAAIASGVHLLSRAQLDENAGHIVGLMQSSVKRLSRLIDNALAFSRGRWGDGLLLERECMPLEPVLWQVIDEISKSQPKREIKTAFNLDNPFDGDHARVAQLFSNLLGYAVARGAEDTPIRVEASQDATGFKLVVAHAGKPFPPADLKRLFQPLYLGQLGRSLRGTGLGLVVASDIARAHGGRLNVTSSSHETRFTLTIPALSGNKDKPLLRSGKCHP